MSVPPRTILGNLPIIPFLQHFVARKGLWITFD
jgi:hypothetical protein